MVNQRVVVITGVSRGLGRAMIEEFVLAGHQVLGCVQTPESAAELQARFGAPHDFAVVDVTEEDQVQAWAERAIAQYGPPDLLLNNAGVINHLAPLWEVPSEEFNRVIDVNIKGVANVIRHFLPAMADRNSGVIVNFSSGWGRSTSPEVAPYCASKWAIEGLTQALAQELPLGMAAIALNPGIIHTDMLEICFGPAASSYTPLKVWGRRAVAFLLKLSVRDNGAALTVPA